MATKEAPTGVAFWLCLAALIAACGSSQDFQQCVSSTQCNFSTGGVCTQNRQGHSWCQYPEDPTICPGGWRWSSEAGDDLSAVCVMAFAITVDKKGDGGGTVASAPAGIDCGTKCVTQVADNHVITLHATPDGNSRLGEWGDAGASCSGETCAVTVSNAIGISVTFDKIPVYDLVVTKVGDGIGTVTSSPGTIDCGSLCMDKFREGQMVTLTATAGNQSFFAGWGGACLPFGNNMNCTVTMDALKAATATFTKIPDYSVGVTLVGMGLVTSDPAGIDCPGSCIKAFGQGTAVTLTATPASGWRWVQWKGASGCATSTTCTVTVDTAKSVTAEFMQIPLRTVTVAKVGVGIGTVTSSDGTINCGAGQGCTHVFQEGAVVMLTATPDAGTFTEFAGWGGDAASCSASTTCTLVIDADKNITAMFNPMPIVSVTITGGGTGTVTSQPSGLSCPDTCSARFPTNTAVKLTATPASGSGLVGWGGDAVSCGFDGACTIQAAGTKSAGVRFEKGGYVAWAVKAAATGFAGVKNVRSSPDKGLVLAGVYSGQGDVNNQPLADTVQGVKTPYVAKLAGMDGAVRWARGFPTNGLLYANVFDFAIDTASGDIVLVGNFDGNLDLGGAQSLVSDANGDLFVARLSGVDASHVWSFVISSTADEPAIHVALDQGRVLVMGSFTSSINLGDGIVRPTKGFQDMYLVWHSLANGALLSDPPPKTIGDTNASIIVSDVVVDSSHNIVATGSFSGTTKFGGGSLDPSHSPRGTGDAFVSKYDSTGVFLWVVTGGGPTANFAYSTAVGPGNSVYVTGQANLGMATDTVIFDGVQAMGGSGTSDEIFAVGITSDGSVTWVRRFGGLGSDYPQRVAVDGAGNVVIDGAFNQSFSFDAFPVSANGSESDAFVSVLDSSSGGSVVWADRYGGPNVDEAHGLAIDPSTQHWLVAGGFSSISKFGDKDLTAAGSEAGFCARVIPGAR